jgi:transposase-like protein
MKRDGKKKHKKSGAPTTFRPEMVTMATAVCMLGATNDELARCLGCAPQTLDGWLKRIPELREAVADGKLHADAKVAASLYRRATGYSHRSVKIFQHEGQIIEAPFTEHYPPDPTSMIFWLKNRRRADWRDQHRDEAGPAGATADPAEALPELARRIAYLLTAATLVMPAPAPAKKGSAR